MIEKKNYPTYLLFFDKYSLSNLLSISHSILELIGLEIGEGTLKLIEILYFLLLLV